MKVLVTGSSGLVGSALVPFLAAGGHTVVRLVRRAKGGDSEAPWDPAAGSIDRAAIEGVDAVVHLAGESIAEGRWTAEKKARLRDSRVGPTRLLAEALGGLARKPGALVAASAVGYYGDRGDEVMTETSGPAPDFLGRLCQDWEAATKPAAEKGIRVVNLRIGIVLSPNGGALGKMLLPFKLGAGGKVGSGRQYMSWIALDDVIGAFHHALATTSLEGPVNACAPEPVTNERFTKTLGKVLSRPTIAPLPAFAARLAFGEMADALLLSSTRMRPERLLDSGYRFRYPELEGALRHLLGRSAA
ncbi:MAG TPA: TIGR01777 family oxidoreductase [Vicinamibacteria bacterium]|nr:TIGR01777 family oxidoreductase [Vicinamibacteria bacterium]